ncbi:MAG: 5-(carboxyamino)imidazole ribonucleotide synthase [Thermoanaerobaculia bacterium]|nr:5-(carboxyamino)imidazole ribonucleotide synthase [Thermoanaerobaculia bacterium]
MISPGATLGILGSGQLGRMLALSARSLGFRVHVFSPEGGAPAGQVADRDVVAPYLDLAALRRFAAEVDVVTFEFENVPAVSAETLAECVPVRPAGRVLATTQNRLREKRFLAAAGFPVAPFRAAHSAAELGAAVRELGAPVIVKTAGWGYDGKGQVRLEGLDGVAAAWERLATDEAVVEAVVDFECELSVVAARGVDGELADYGVVENRHVHHILDLTLAPASLPAATERAAREMARGVLESLEIVGVLGVEMFLTRSGQLVINELAPRPHNSGHWTLDGAATSQFEQQLRAVCGWPLGSTRQHRPAAMANLLGDLWADGEPDWAAALAAPEVHLHLYGKAEARPGRKMGHLTALGDTVAEAAARVAAARRALRRREVVA